MIIRKTAYPRAGLIGNPSDGYFGKTIAFTFSNFEAVVVLYESPELQILPNTRDHSVFDNIEHLADDVKLFGYYGGIRLLKAAVKRFSDHARDSGFELHDRNFSIRYHSNIPHLVGLAGSSAIITACFKSLMEFYGVNIPRSELANLVLSVETSELGISAGLQDRVAQVYQGLVYMDFNKDTMSKQGYGLYEEMDPSLLPSLYIAYREDLSEGSEIVHSDMRARFSKGDPVVLEAIAFWADLSDKVRAALSTGDHVAVGSLLNQNFDRRRKVCAISEGNTRMVEAARSVGASAKFTGSGGAIVGTYDGEEMFKKLVRALEPLKIKVLRPDIAPATGE